MGKETSAYAGIIHDLFKQIENEMPNITKVAAICADEIEKDHLIHVIGTGGHSNLMPEETLSRAGGLACMNSMLDVGTAMQLGAYRSCMIERTPGYGTTMFEVYDCKPGEVILICNAYGINSMTIDVALEAKRRGLITVGITSRSFCDTIPAGHVARHPSAKNLYEVVDYWLDTHVPYPDACGEIEGFDKKVAASSVLCNSFMWNLLLIEICRICVERGVTPPVWSSGNAIGGDEANAILQKKYIPRVRHLW